MKRTIIGVALILGMGCHGTPAPTNSGLSQAASSQVGQKSSNGKAQTGSIMTMNESNVPPALAKKMFAHK
jgi:hypothetical protein